MPRHNHEPEHFTPKDRALLVRATRDGQDNATRLKGLKADNQCLALFLQRVITQNDQILNLFTRPTFRFSVGPTVPK